MTPPGAPGEGGYGPGVWFLAVGQTLGYACFFYIFAALVLHWQRDTGWDPALLALGPTLAILMAAALAAPVGRAVDPGPRRAAPLAGPAGGAAALAVLAMAASPVVYLAAWAGLGVAQALSLYEACFALLVRRYGDRARGAITRVTLVAGLASTLAFPAGNVLAEVWGWRAAVWAAAGAALFGILPLHAAGLRALAPRGAVLLAAPSRGAPLAALRRSAFWLLAGLFAAAGLGHWTVVSFLLPLLDARGVAPGMAVLAASCIGPAQVAGRLALMAWEARIGTVRATVLTMAGFLGGASLLALAGAGAAFVLAFALVQGAAMGVMTILRPVLVAQILGRDGFGAIAGMMHMTGLAATAAAPVFGAVLMRAGGADLLTGAAVALGLVAVGLAQVLRAAVRT
ncbi:MAG TPA: MFS transporter [Paracoccaceae bacterium]|nr:MFS transporter [Paracoccaceae bacterium]